MKRERPSQPRTSGGPGGRPCPGTGSASLQEIESRIGHVATDAFKGPGERLLGPCFLTTVEYFSAEAGRFNEVDVSFFDTFLELTTTEMAGFIASTFHAFRRHIRLAILEARATGDHWLLAKFLETALYMAVRGNVRFLDHPHATLCRAIGPRPTLEQQQRILDRIRSDKPLQIPVLRKLIAAYRDGSLDFGAEPKSGARG